MSPCQGEGRGCESHRPLQSTVVYRKLHKLSRRTTSEGINAPESLQFQANQEVQIIPENSRAIEVLNLVESRYPKTHLITGSLGVQGVVGREFRAVHDMDMCIPRQDAAEAIDFFIQSGFTQLPPERARHLHGNGTILQSSDGFSVDIWFGDFSAQGLVLRSPDGELFIPSEGLEYAAELRGVQFRTFSPEVYYLFKNRAVSRHPLRTISPFNRPQDVTDYEQLKRIVDTNKTKSLIAHGLSYRGKHSLPRIIKEQIGDKIRSVVKAKK